MPVIAEELPAYPVEIYEKGVKLITHEFERDLPYVKSTNYVTGFRLIPEKKEQGAFEVLYCWRGKFLECSRDNFFVFRGDVLATPGNYVLRGITRQVLLSIARAQFQVEERDVLVDEVHAPPLHMEVLVLLEEGLLVVLDDDVESAVPLVSPDEDLEVPADLPLLVAPHLLVVVADDELPEVAARVLAPVVIGTGVVHAPIGRSEGLFTSTSEWHSSWKII